MSNFTDINKAFNNQSQNNYEYNSLIIKPPDRNKTHGTITKSLLIDSRDRDYQKYPNSNKFRVEISEEYRDVTSLKLVSGKIPSLYYNIKSTNQNFYISENFVLHKIEIPEGSYNDDTLLDELNGKNGNLFLNLNNKYNFTKNQNNLKLRMQSNGAFTFNLNYELNNDCNNCPVKSMDNLLGFVNKAYESETILLNHIFIEPNNITYLNKKSEEDYKVYKLKAISNTSEKLDFKKLFQVGDYINLKAGNIIYQIRIYKVLNNDTIEFESLDNNNPIALIGNVFDQMHILNSDNIYTLENKDYIIMKIKEAKVIVSSSTSVNNSYAVIPLQNSAYTVINSSTLPDVGVVKYFNPPLGKFFWIDIEFLNYDGSLFDFKGQEVSLLFVVAQLNQPGKYNNILETW